MSKVASGEAKRAGNLEEAAGYLAEMAKEDALAGNVSFAEKAAKEALAISKEKSVESDAGIALALAGDKADSARLVSELNKRFPKDTMVQVSIATMRACILLSDGKSAQASRQAVEALAGTTRYDANGLQSLLPVYVRGRAYLAAGQDSDAAAEFQKILDHPGVTRNFITAPLARLSLAEAADRAGDRARAREHYATFLELWRDADPDLPMLRAAKASYAHLSASLKVAK